MIYVIGICSPLCKWELVLLVCIQPGEGPHSLLISPPCILYVGKQAQQAKMTCPGSHGVQSCNCPELGLVLCHNAHELCPFMVAAFHPPTSALGPRLPEGVPRADARLLPLPASVPHRCRHHHHLLHTSAIAVAEGGVMETEHKTNS